MSPASVIPDARRPEPATGFGAYGESSLHVRRAAGRLLAVLAFGQLVFAAYVGVTYGRSAIAGQLDAWSRFSAHGWVSGDGVGNAAMAAHVLLAAAVLLTGTVQLIPSVRRRWPTVHRWSGRVFLTGSLIAAVSGLWLVWGRGTVGDAPQHVAISCNAVLLAVCAMRAWRTAVTRQIARHRDWALRTYLVAGGVFYFRTLLALWLLVFRRPVGFDPETFSGPFLTTLAFGVYVVGPLSLFESYRWVVARGRRTHAPLAVRTLTLLALVGAAGVVSAVLVLWLPKVR